MEKTNFRKYNEWDIDAVREITEEPYYSEFQSFQKEKVELALLNDELVGWGYINVPQSSVYSGFVFIYVKPELRRKGIGTAIYKIAEKQFLAEGCNWWSSYPESNGADGFALSVGFDYTNTNSELVHNGEMIPISSSGIRVCHPDDYKTVDSLWSREYAAMHRRLGLPYEAHENTADEERESYDLFCKNINNYFVLETDGEIVGMGSLFEDNSGIGSLAVDRTHAGKGYGTRLAAFLTNECIRRGTKSPVLYCETGNNDAMHVYKKIGYVEQKRESVAFHK